jgi:Lrp/AsnC family transcriptional regulator, leucine-responsive regulatory protein
LEHLTYFERELLKLLTEDSRRSVTEMSIRLKVSRLRITRTIEALKLNGVIRKFSVELEKIDKSQITGVRAFFMVRMKQPKCKLLFETIRHWPEVIGAWSVSSSEVDMQIQVHANELSHLERLRDKISTHPVVLHLYTTAILKDWKNDGLT